MPIPWRIAYCSYSPFLLIQQLIRIIFRPELVHYIGFIDLPIHGVLDNAYLYSRHFIPVILNRRDGILKMLLDSLSQLPGLAYKQQLILAVVEHKDAAFFPSDLMEIRKAINMTSFWSLLLMDNYLWRWNRNRYQVFSRPLRI
jgi:hypothetical protein